MTSEGNSALLPANVDRRLPLLLPLHVFFLCYITNHFERLVSWETVHFCFPRISMFPSAAPRGNIEILGKQNELFPRGPVIMLAHKVKVTLISPSAQYLATVFKFLSLDDIMAAIDP